jgi:molecular chaperone GrpE
MKLDQNTEDSIKKMSSQGEEPASPTEPEGGDTSSRDDEELSIKIKEMESKISEKEKEIEELKNLWLRCQADFDNFRKRKQKEIQDIRLYAGESFINDLLPVIDNFERALATTSDKDDPFYRGVELIYQQLKGVLEKHDIREIEALGKIFDPNFHEAVTQVNSEEYEDDMVAEVLQKGYTYHSKVLRPSRVKVCKK